SDSPQCISRWTLLVPPDPAPQREMVDARAGFKDWIEIFSARPTATVYDDISVFGKWIKGDKALPPDPSTALLVLSHHDKNALFFDADKEVPSILSTNITRRFGAPSVAIVNACGTARPGAFDVVKQLNRRGVNSIIATSVSVNAEM